MAGDITNARYNSDLKRVAYLIGLSFLMLSSVLTSININAYGPTSNQVLITVCQLYNTVHAVIFVIGLALIIIGASLYAGGTILPGNLKGTAQGYGMGMIVGGVIGVVLAISAGFILGIITGNTSVVSTCTSNALTGNNIGTL